MACTLKVGEAGRERARDPANPASLCCISFCARHFALRAEYKIRKGIPAGCILVAPPPRMVAVRGVSSCWKWLVFTTSWAVRDREPDATCQKYILEGKSHGGLFPLSRGTSHGLCISGVLRRGHEIEPLLRRSNHMTPPTTLLVGLDTVATAT